MTHEQCSDLCGELSKEWIMRFRILCINVGSILAFSYAPFAQAAILEVKLIGLPTSTPGLFDIRLEARTDTSQPSSIGHLGQPAGGISGLEFTVRSQGTNLSAPVPDGPSGIELGRVKTIWAITGFGTLIKPLNMDTLATSPANYVPAYTDPDTDLDARAGAFVDPNTFQNTTLGVNGFELIATMQWQLLGASSDILILHVKGAQWYDSDNGTAPAFRGTYDIVNTNEITLIPEPGALILAGMSIPAFALVICGWLVGKTFEPYFTNRN
jgi:hypothetical protein